MNNTIGCFTNCYGKYGVEEALKNIPKIGLKYAELGLKAHGGYLVIPESKVPSTSMDDAEIAKFKDRLRNLGLTPCSGNIALGDGSEVGPFKSKLDFLKKMGIKTAVTSVSHKDSTADRKGLFKKLREIGDHAAGLGVVVAFETHPGIVQNADEILKTMKELNHRNLRVNFDTANIYYYNEGVDLEDQLKRAAPYIAHVHLKDSRKNPKEWYFPALGDGLIDFPMVFRTLNGVGFTGPFSMEIEGIAGEDLTLDQIQARLKKSVDYLRKIGVMG